MITSTRYVGVHQDFPDHRLKFFGLLRAITNHCFACLYSMTPVQLKLVRLPLLVPLPLQTYAVNVRYSLHMLCTDVLLTGRLLWCCR